jgi:hypothetical protein
VVIVGLLVIALVCLIVGLVLPNAAWLVASLIATCGAGYLLFRSRTVVTHATTESTKPSRSTRTRERPARAVANAKADLDDADDVADDAGRRDSADGADSADSADLTDHATVKDDLAGTAAVEDLDHTQVIDMDDAHTQVIPAVPAADVEPDEAEPAAEPEPKPEPVPESAASASDRDVWVIDGRPRYHLQTCAIIKGQDAEPIPWEQATEDGFMPCSLCEPDSVRA